MNTLKKWESIFWYGASMVLTILFGLLGMVIIIFCALTLRWVYLTLKEKFINEKPKLLSSV